jgi:ATP-dependent DNA helicase PIF1
MTSLLPSNPTKGSEGCNHVAQFNVRCRNDTVQEIKDYIMDKLSSEEMVYMSCDMVCTASIDGSDELYPTEFLNTLKFSGIPDHELRLKVGLPVMLLRNINETAGLYNGIRMTITQCGNKYIEVQIITRIHVGDKVCIPRIIMIPNDTK